MRLPAMSSSIWVIFQIICNLPDPSALPLLFIRICLRCDPEDSVDLSDQIPHVLDPHGKPKQPVIDPVFFSLRGRNFCMCLRNRIRDQRFRFARSIRTASVRIPRRISQQSKGASADPTVMEI